MYIETHLHLKYDDTTKTIIDEATIVCNRQPQAETSEQYKDIY